MIETTIKQEGDFLRTLGRAFVTYCRKHAEAPDCEEFASFLVSQNLPASVSLIYRLEAGDKVYYSERLQSSAIFWRARLGNWNCILPRPVNQEQFSETKDFRVTSEPQAPLTPASLGECVPAVLDPLRDDWEVKTPGRLYPGEPPPFSQPRALPTVNMAIGSEAGMKPPSGNGSAGGSTPPPLPLASDAVARAYMAFCEAVSVGDELARIDDLCTWIGRTLGVETINREEVRFGVRRPTEEGFWPCSSFEYPYPEPEAWLLAWCGAAQKWQGLLLPVIKDKSRFSRSPVAFAPHDQTPDSLVWIEPARVIQSENYGWELTMQGRLEGLPVGIRADLARCYSSFRTCGPRFSVALPKFAAWISRWFDHNEDARKRLAGNKTEVWPVALQRSSVAGAFLERVEPGHEQYWLVVLPGTNNGALFPSFTDHSQALEDAGEVFRRVPPKPGINTDEECAPALARVLPGEEPALLEILQKGRITDCPDSRSGQTAPFWKRLFHKVDKR